MLNKKFVILITLLISLLAISAVNAADNNTMDVVGVNNLTDEIVSVEDDNQIIGYVDGEIESLNVNSIDNQTTGNMDNGYDSGVYKAAPLDFQIPSLDVDSDNKGVLFLFSDNVTGTVTLTVDGKDYNFVVVEGTVNITLPNLPNGVYNYTFFYSGDSIHASFVKNGIMTVNKTEKNSTVNSTIDLTINFSSLDIVSDGSKAVFSFPYDATGTVTLSVSGKDYVFSIVSGAVYVNLPNLPNGVYNYTIFYSGDSKYSPFVKKGNLNVNKTGHNSGANNTVDFDFNVPSMNVTSENHVVTIAFPNDAKGTLTLSVGNANYVFDVLNGEVYLKLPNLPNGIYNYTLFYSGDSKYSSFVKTGSMTVNIPSETNSSTTTNNTVVFDIDLPSLEVTSDNENIAFAFPKDATGYVTLTVDGKDYIFGVANGIVKIKWPNLQNGIYNYTFSYSGNSKYSSFVKNANVKFNKPVQHDVESNKTVVSDMNIPALDVTSGNRVVFIDFPLDAKGNVTLTVEGKNYVFDVMDGVVNLEVPKLPNGNYNYTLLYSGDNKYSSFSKTGSFKVNTTSETQDTNITINPEIDIPPLDEVSNDNPVTVTFPSDAKGTLTLTINGVDYDFDVINGVANVKLPELDDGDYNYTISYSGDKKYSSFVKEGRLNINKTSEASGNNVTILPEISIPPFDGVSNNGSVAITFPSDAKGAVTLTIDGVGYVFNVINGVADVKLPELDDGDYNYTIFYSGDVKYSSFVKTGSMNVNKTSEVQDVNGTTDSEINIPSLDNMLNGESATIALPKDATGNVSLEIAGKVYTFPVEDGGAILRIPGLESGNYNYTIIYSGDKKYPSFSSSGSLEISNPGPALLVPDVTMPPLSDALKEGYVIVNVPADVGGNVSLYINGKEYLFKVNNGKANITLPDLEKGDYEYSITYYPESKYATGKDIGILIVKENENSSNSNPTVNINPPSFGKIFSGESVSIAFPEDAGGKVILTIDGKNYDFPVKNGAANIVVPNFADGSSSYEIKYSGDSKYLPFTASGSLDKIPNFNPKIVASNAKVTYNAGSYYTIKVYAANDILANGANVKISGKISKALKTTNGVVKFKVTQKPGKYKITITSLGKSVNKTITVKHLLTLKTITVKKSAKKLVLQSKLGKIKGKYLKNKKITFKFNGKKYTAKTNSKGIAKVTIKSSVLKKLKVGKKITYQATYSKDTVKKAVKVKK